MQCIRIDPVGTLSVENVSYADLQSELGEALSDWGVPSFPEIISVSALDDSNMLPNGPATRIMGGPYCGPVYLLSRHYKSLSQDEINCLLDYLEGESEDD